MSQLEEGPEAYELDDRCVVPWNDGSIYAGKVQKILDPARKVVIQGVPTRKGGKSTMIEDLTPFEKLKNDRHQRIPKSVLEASQETNERWYYVHYFGWKTNYDEWLPLNRMLPHTPRNINEMKRVNAELKELERQRKEQELLQKKGKKRPASNAGPSTPSSANAKQNSHARDDSASPSAGSTMASQPRPSKRQATNEIHSSREGTPALSSRSRRKVVLSDGPALEIQLSVPLELKRLLVKDWQLVTRDREIVRLPRSICVTEILQDFLNAQEPNKTTGNHENLANFVYSMTTYFDYAFGMMLLYRFERNQYYQQRNGDPAFRPSLIYGAEHLARLIISMPSLLTQLSAMDDITMKYVVKQVEQLAVFLSDHKNRYFAGEQSYDSATRIYESSSIPHLSTEPVVPHQQQVEKNESVETE